MGGAGEARRVSLPPEQRVPVGKDGHRPPASTSQGSAVP